MNPETLLNEVEVLILHRPASSANRWHLCHTSDRLQLLPSSHVLTAHPVFMNLTARHFRFGLSNPEWELLLQKLAVFYERKI